MVHVFVQIADALWGQGWEAKAKLPTEPDPDIPPPPPPPPAHRLVSWSTVTERAPGSTLVAHALTHKPGLIALSASAVVCLVFGSVAGVSALPWLLAAVCCVYIGFVSATLFDEREAWKVQMLARRTEAVPAHSGGRHEVVD